MKAFALKLIKGFIDEVDQVVHVNWVQSRVLNPDQIANLKHGITDWNSKVENVARLVENESRDILVQ